MNNSSEDNGFEILRYIKFGRTLDDRCMGVIHILANEDGVQPYTMCIVRDTAGEILRELREMAQ